MCLLYKFIFALLIFNFVNGDDRPRRSKTKVAIIGGGIGGTVTAYELSYMVLQQDLYEVDIDLFEHNEIGGRLATVLVDGLEFESGGSIIHPKNKYMKRYADKFSLPKVEHQDEFDIFGLFDGKHILFMGSEYKYLTILYLGMRYGFLNLYFNNRRVNEMIDNFARIYALLDTGIPFNNVYQLLIAANIDFLKMMKMTYKEKLLKCYVPEDIIKELAYVANNVNYNQDIGSIHAFAGEVAMAGAQDSLWSVLGGNRKVAEALLLHSFVSHIKERVEAISITGDSRYILETNSSNHVYDYIIIACPQVKNSLNNIKLNIPTNNQIDIEYQRTVATFVQGNLNCTYFKSCRQWENPNQIFSIDPESFFSSVSLVYPVEPSKEYKKNVFKVFSKEPLTDDQLDLLFYHRKEVVVNDWWAYPKYSTEMKMVPFELRDKLYYLNSIEIAASAMEMSAISGKNMAMLVGNKLLSERSVKPEIKQNSEGVDIDWLI